MSACAPNSPKKEMRPFPRPLWAERDVSASESMSDGLSSECLSCSPRSTCSMRGVAQDLLLDYGPGRPLIRIVTDENPLVNYGAPEEQDERFLCTPEHDFHWDAEETLAVSRRRNSFRAVKPRAAAAAGQNATATKSTRTSRASKSGFTAPYKAPAKAPAKPTPTSKRAEKKPAAAPKKKPAAATVRRGSVAAVKPRAAVTPRAAGGRYWG